MSPMMARRDTFLVIQSPMTPLFWTFKLARMLHALAKRDGMPPSDHRRKQADALVADPDGALGVYDRLKRPDADLTAVLKAMNLWAAPPFDPSGPIARYFPDQTVDLTPQSVDGWLRRKKSHILSFLKM